MMKIIRLSLLLFALPFFVLACNNDDSSYEYEPQISISGEIQISIDSEVFTLSLYDNQTAQAFRAMLPLSLNMNELNGNEKYYDLSSSLPTSLVRPSTIHNGDLMLYGNRTLVLFYKSFSNSYNYTRIGRVNNPLGLEYALGEGGVTVRFEESTSVVQYTLAYNANGATSGNVPQTVTAKEGAIIVLGSGDALSRTGYEFVGWNTDANGTGNNYIAGSSYILNNDITLYAKWKEAQIDNEIMKITVGSTTFIATLIENATVTEFKKMLPMTINMSDVNNNEKYYNLPNSLPTSPQHYSTINNGDIMLWGSNGLVLFYETFFSGYSYTPLGKVNNPSGLKNALNGNNIMVTFELEQ